MFGFFRKTSEGKLQKYRSNLFSNSIADNKIPEVLDDGLSLHEVKDFASVFTLCAKKVKVSAVSSMAISSLIKLPSVGIDDKNKSELINAYEDVLGLKGGYNIRS